MGTDSVTNVMILWKTHLRNTGDVEKKEFEMKKKGWKGSFTAEAAAVISISFLVLGTLLLTVFFLHDKAVFQGIVCETASAGSNFAMEKERAEAADNMRKGVQGQRFLGSRNLSVTKETGDKNVSVSAGADYPVPGMFMRFLRDGKMQIRCIWNCRILYPGKTIRQIRGAELLFQMDQE